MSDVFSAILDDRAILHIGGSDAKTLLQGLVTVDLDRLEKQSNIFGALLAPQGKIQFDFFIHRSDNGVLIDIDKSQAAPFLKRMMLYKLRTDVTLQDVSDNHSVLVRWGENINLDHPDARLTSLGSREIVTENIPTNAGSNDYHTHRIHLGIPEAGKDFPYNDIFPHDAMMDVLGGVNFDKGCYVGQEVVSRIQHRGTARKRFFVVNAENNLPGAGEAVKAGDKVVGTLGASSGQIALALLRTDRFQSENNLIIGEVEANAKLPDYFDQNHG